MKKENNQLTGPENFFEKVLITKLKEGDKNAFSLIFTIYYKDLVLFATNYIHKADLAEEIVQDTFVKIWEEHEELNIVFSLKSFLLKSVQNKCIDMIRHQKIRQNHINDVILNSPDYEYNTDNYLTNSELVGLIKTTLDNLPDEISQAYRMNRFEGLKYHEIAEKLNISVRTVEVRIGRALCSLRHELQDYLI
ncbi:MAG: RNA polymerase sigma-70 factor [Bacteroidales bacterium]